MRCSKGSKLARRRVLANSLQRSAATRLSGRNLQPMGAMANRATRSGRDVLVVGADAVVGALLGLLVELAGDRPLFPDLGESPHDAIARLRPPLVLLDCNHDAACEDAAYERAAHMGTEVVLFAHHEDVDRLERMAGQRSAHALRLPVPPTTLGDFVTTVLAA